jgi:hypothetical protein
MVESPTVTATPVGTVASNATLNFLGGFGFCDGFGWGSDSTLTGRGGFTVRGFLLVSCLLATIGLGGGGIGFFLMGRMRTGGLFKPGSNRGVGKANRRPIPKTWITKAKIEPKNPVDL